jgi:hypothetical protein
VPLQHRGAIEVQFVLERANDSGMIVADVVNAVARIEIENTLGVGSEYFGTEASSVANIHTEYVE